jgi:hypothetical protein
VLVRKQYYVRPAETGVDAWDVDRLIELSRGRPVREVDVDSIGELDQDHWFFHREDRPTVREIVEHIRLICDVDTSHPVILGPDGRLMDGMHRVARALLDGRTTIAAVQLEALPLPDFRGCSPEDLPY